MASEPDFVLDASALLALHYAEPGAEVVEAALDLSIVCSVNLTEVVGKLTERGWKKQEIDKALSLPCRVVAFDARMARRAGELIALGQRSGLSFGDRACLATALTLGIGQVLTADPALTKLKVKGVQIRPIR